MKMIILFITVMMDLKFRIIVFTQFRDTALIIEQNLNKIDGVCAKVFVGQAKKNGSGLSQKEQKKIIEEFSAGEVNVLVATSIAEEGLDIPEVNSVIFYEPVASAIRSIQRRGRTARLSKGKLIMLITKDKYNLEVGETFSNLKIKSLEPELNKSSRLIGEKELIKGVFFLQHV